MSEKIVLELNQVSQKRAIGNLLTDSIEELADLIFKRIEQAKDKKNEINASECSKKYFDNSKEHDSILIDGTRGTGKTTVIRNINDFLFKKDRDKWDKIKVLPIIDPNYIDNSANILSIIIRVIFDTVKNDSFRNEKDEFKTICELKDEIEDVIFSASKQKYVTSRESSKTVKGEMDLDYTIHKFACKVCSFFDVESLILPIDDIDMAIEHGSSIVEILRRYMQTPKIIPVIALDSAQIYALIKKEYFSKFGLEASMPLHEIDTSSELNFLQKLPSEYIQKILPPAQRVMLPDMLGHYKNHLDAKLNPRSKKQEIYFKFSKEHNRNWEIEWSFDELLKILMNILFGYDGEEILNADDYHIVNYLKNKTFRSFLDDVKALMKAMKQSEKNKNIYTVDMQIIKNRFKLPSRATASNKYDATLWFWNRYIEEFYKNLEDSREKKDLFGNDDFKIDLVEDILTVTPEDAKDLGRKEKIYYRLFLQDYFIEKVVIIQQKEKIEVKKEVNIYGLIELILRTLFPALLLEHFINYKFISLDSFPLEKLKEFSNTDVHTTLIELYDSFIPSWVGKYYINEEENNINYKQVCELNKVYKIDRNDILHYKTYYDFSSNTQKYYLHSYKFWVFFSEMDKFIYFYKESLKNESNLNYLNKLISKYIPKSSRPVISTEKTIKKFQANFDIYKSSIKSDLTNSKIGILSLIESVDYIVKNLSIINSNIIDFEFFKNKIEKINPNFTDDGLNILYKKEVERYLAFMESIFLNGLIVYFLKNSNININLQNIEEDYIISGTNRYDLFKFAIVNNAFLKNLFLFFELKEGQIKNLKRFMFVYIDLYSSKINKLYIFEDKIIDEFKKLGTQKYKSKEEALKEKTEEILSNIEIYSKLFVKFIDSEFNYKKIGEAFEKSTKLKIYAKVLDAINELKINRIEDNIERNLKEMMVYIVAYQEDKVKDFLEYKEKGN